MSDLEKEFYDFLDNEELEISYSEEYEKIKKRFDKKDATALNAFAFHIAQKKGVGSKEAYKSFALSSIFSQIMTQNLYDISASSLIVGDLYDVNKINEVNKETYMINYYFQALGYFISKLDHKNIQQCAENAIKDGFSKEKIEKIYSHYGYEPVQVKDNEIDNNSSKDVLNQFLSHVKDAYVPGGDNSRLASALEAFAKALNANNEKDDSSKKGDVSKADAVPKKDNVLEKDDLPKKDVPQKKNNSVNDYNADVDFLLSGNLLESYPEMLLNIKNSGVDNNLLREQLIREVIKYDDKYAFGRLKALATLYACKGDKQGYYKTVLSYHLQACSNANRRGNTKFLKDKLGLIRVLAYNCAKSGMSFNDISSIFRRNSFDNKFSDVSLEELIPNLAKDTSDDFYSDAIEEISSTESTVDERIDDIINSDSIDEGDKKIEDIDEAEIDSDLSTSEQIDDIINSDSIDNKTNDFISEFEKTDFGDLDEAIRYVLRKKRDKILDLSDEKSDDSVISRKVKRKQTSEKHLSLKQRILQKCMKMLANEDIKEQQKGGK